MLWVAKELVLFMMSVREDSEIREYAFMHYRKFTPPIDMVEETLGYICLLRSTDDEVNQSMGRSNGALEPESLSAEE